MRHSAHSQPSASSALPIPQGQGEKISSWEYGSRTKKKGADMRSSSQRTQGTSGRRSQQNTQPVLHVLLLSSLFMGLSVGGKQLEAKVQGACPWVPQRIWGIEQVGDNTMRRANGRNLAHSINIHCIYSKCNKFP